MFKPYAGVKTSVLVFRRPTTEPAEGRAATGRVWFYEIRNDGYDPDKIQSGGRPETPEKNDIPALMSAWGEYKASGLPGATGCRGRRGARCRQRRAPLLVGGL